MQGIIINWYMIFLIFRISFETVIFVHAYSDFWQTKHAISTSDVHIDFCSSDIFRVLHLMPRQHLEIFFFSHWFWLSCHQFLKLVNFIVHPSPSDLTTLLSISLYMDIITPFFSILSVWEYISLSIANLSWMPMNLFSPNLFWPLQLQLNDFWTDSLNDNKIKRSCVNRFCPSAMWFIGCYKIVAPL